MQNTLKPIEEPFADDIIAALSKFPSVDGKLVTLFLTFANSRRFLEKGIPNLLDDESPVTLKHREIVILRVTSNNNCEYEWGLHMAVFGDAAGFMKGQKVDIGQIEINPALWNIEERVLIEVVDQLCFHGRIEEGCRAKFQSYFTAKQQLEIFALCGTYHTVSYVANVAALPPEIFAHQFPNRC